MYPDEPLRKQLPKQITFHTYKNQKVVSGFYVLYCFFFLEILGGMDFCIVALNNFLGRMKCLNILCFFKYNKCRKMLLVIHQELQNK